MIIILEIIEMIKVKKLVADDRGYFEVGNDSHADGPGVNDGKDELLRQMLSKLRADKFTKNDPHGLLDKFGGRRCMSMEEFGNEKEEDPRNIDSYPLTPKRMKDREGPFHFEKPHQPDNVFAEAKPFDPNYRKGKQFADADAQAIPEEIMNRKGGDLLNPDDSDEERRRMIAGK